MATQIKSHSSSFSSIPTILLIGYRKDAAKTALDLNYSVVVWDDQKITSTLPLTKIIQLPYVEQAKQLTNKHKKVLKENHFDAVIGCKENTLMSAAIVRHYLKLPGNTIKTSLLCHDKLIMKAKAKKLKIPITDYLPFKEKNTLHIVEKKLGSPWVLKQKASSGGRGLRLISSNHQIDLPIKELKNNWLAERLVEGKEYSVESFIQHDQIKFTNITEYYQKKHVNFLSQEIPVQLKKEILVLNKKIIKGFSIPQGMTHLEVYVRNGDILFGEVALRPPGGYIMKLISLAYGFNPWQAYICMETNRKFSFPKKFKQCVGVWIIHPGEGRLKNISGYKNINQMPNVHSFVLSLKPNDIIIPRIGVGIDCGHLIFTGKNRHDLIATIEGLQKKLIFKMEK